MKANWTVIPPKIHEKADEIVVGNFNSLNEVGHYYFCGKIDKSISESAIGKWIIKYKES